MSKKRKQSAPAVNNVTLHKKNKKKNKKLKDGKKKVISKKLLTNLNGDVTKSSFIATQKPKDGLKKRKNKIQKKKQLAEKDATQKSLNPKANKYGAASSESEPEPIESTWNIDVRENKDIDWKDTSSVSDSQEAALESSDDLEESESDNDEELDEHELNSLIAVSRKRPPGSSSEEETSSNTCDSLSEDDPVPSNRQVRKNQNVALPSGNDRTKPKIDQPSEPVDEPPQKPHIPTTEAPVDLSLNDEQGILDEIRRRSVDLASRSLYISPVPPDCNLERLKLLSPDIISCRLSYNPVTKTCRKYAFLEYRDAEAAAAARKAINGRLFAGRNVSAQPGRAQFTQQSGGLDQVDRRQLFISGIHPTVTRADLHQVFPKAELDYPFHSAGYSLGYAIAKFVNEAVALESFIKAHNRSIRGHAIFINYVMRSHKPVKPSEQLTKSSTAKTDPPKSTSAVDHAKLQVPQTALTTDSSAPLLKQSESRLVAQSLPNNSSVSNNKPKVLIQPINDVGSDSDDRQSEADEDDAHDMFSKLRDLDEEDDGTFLRKRVNPKTDEPAKPSNLLTNLFRLQKRNKPDLTNRVEKPKTGDDDMKQSKSKGASNSNSDDEDNDDRSEDSGGASEPEEEETDDSENDHSDESDEDGDAEEDADSDDAEAETEDDEDDAEVNDEISGEEDDSEASEGSEALPSALFSRPPTASERAALDQEPNASEEEIDDTLRVVMKSRRTAMRAIKTAGSKRPWAAKNQMGHATKKRQRSDLAKARKPFELPVPTKRQKL